MTMRLRRLRLTVSTDGGPFGVDLRFQDGLNIVVAPNTSGKSTCVQAILFALGLEGMLGPGREVPLPHAMTQYLHDSANGQHQVRESEVALEIVDDGSQPLTFRRYARHAAISSQLVSVWESPLSDVGAASPRADYFVRRPGSAQREAGFHRFLAERLGWMLPEVPRYTGGSGPLYLEAIAPLWFVEQKRGWSGLQVQTPTYLGIRDVKKRALEFILKLDVQTRATRIDELLTLQRDVEVEWAGIRADLVARAIAAGGAVSGLGSRPEESATPDTAIHIYNQDEWIPLDAALQSCRAQLSELEQREVSIASEVTDQEEYQLREAEASLLRLSLSSAESLGLLELEEATAEDARSGLNSLEADIRRHHDILVLRQLGSDVADVLTREDCPTCGKPLGHAFLDSEPDGIGVLDVGASLAVLEQRRLLYTSLLREAERTVKVRSAELGATREAARLLRGRLRTLKDSLSGRSEVPSVAEIQSRLELQARLATLAQLRDAWQIALDQLKDLRGRSSQIGAELRTLRLDGISPKDHVKLEELELSFRSQLQEYGFQSCPIDEVILSPDNYMPTNEGFELVALRLLR